MADNPQVPPPAATPETPPPSPAPEIQPANVSDEKSLAMLAHILGFVTGWLGPLILYLTANEKPFAKRQAQEALNFQITVLIGMIVGGILTMVLIGIFVIIAVSIVDLIYCIMAAMAVNKGEDYRYPFALRLIK